MAGLSRKFIGAVQDDWQMFSDQHEDYTIGPPIGFGASSIVYAADYNLPHPQRPIPCALKVLDLDTLPPRSLSLLQRETQLMSLSKHPNVLRVRGSWMEGHKLYIALRLMNKGSAADIMRYSWPGGMEEEVVKCILRQALEGLKPTATELLQTEFFRSAKKKSYLVGTILTGLPPLAARQERHKRPDNLMERTLDSWDFGTSVIGSISSFTNGQLSSRVPLVRNPSSTSIRGSPDWASFQRVDSRKEIHPRFELISSENRERLPDRYSVVFQTNGLAPGSSETMELDEKLELLVPSSSISSEFFGSQMQQATPLSTNASQEQPNHTGSAPVPVLGPQPSKRKLSVSPPVVPSAASPATPASNVWGRLTRRVSRNLLGIDEPPKETKTNGIARFLGRRNTSSYTQPPKVFL
ncbi:hypothetical protein ID866_815 [Astraeus odoratus]|nr:hypothetical protein ID866_815 [Astraeus odoratus]